MRENGGQYTHGAIWAAMAFAALGDRVRAWELTGMINPVNHSRTAEGLATYKVEPYVVAADVYALPPHTGRGGWTWYTGSAGWMYRLIVESLLGLRLDVDRLHFAPCLPPEWKEFKLHYRHGEAIYHITVRQIARQGESEPDATGSDPRWRRASGQLRSSWPTIASEHEVEVRIARGIDQAGAGPGLTPRRSPGDRLRIPSPTLAHPRIPYVIGHGADRDPAVGATVRQRTERTDQSGHTSIRP